MEVPLLSPSGSWFADAAYVVDAFVTFVTVNVADSLWFGMLCDVKEQVP
jgi:hypothetical protein